MIAVCDNRLQSIGGRTMNEAKFIAGRLDQKMKEKNMGNQELGNAVGLSRTMIYYLRTGRKGKYVTTSGENLAKIAGVLKTSIEYFVNEDADPSPNQKKMSALIADIVEVAGELSPAKQRQFKAIGDALAGIDKSADVDMIYGELMDLITRLMEMDGGEKALTDLLNHLQTVAPRTPPASMQRRSRRRAKGDGGGESADEKAQSGN